MNAVPTYWSPAKPWANSPPLTSSPVLSKSATPSIHDMSRSRQKLPLNPPGNQNCLKIKYPANRKMFKKIINF